MTAGTFGQTAASTIGITGYAHRINTATITGTGVLRLRTRLEARDCVRFKNQSATFSCVVRHDVASAVNYVVYVRYANAADNFTTVTEIANSGNISVPSITSTPLIFSNISMGANCVNGVEVEIYVNCGAISTRTFDFTELQLENGVVSTTFEQITYTDVLQMCQRHYMRWKGTDSYDTTNYDGYIGTGWGNSTTNGYFNIQLPTTLRKQASGIVISAVGDFRTYRRGTATSPSAITYLECTYNMLTISCTSTYNNGDGAGFRTNNVNAYLELVGTEL